MEGAVPDTQAGPLGQPPLQEQEPEACMVAMATATLHPVGPADSLSFCNWGALEGWVAGGVLGLAGAAKFVFIFVKSQI